MNNKMLQGIVSKYTGEFPACRMWTRKTMETHKIIAALSIAIMLSSCSVDQRQGGQTQVDMNTAGYVSDVSPKVGSLVGIKRIAIDDSSPGYPTTGFQQGVEAGLVQGGFSIAERASLERIVKERELQQVTGRAPNASGMNNLAADAVLLISGYSEPDRSGFNRYSLRLVRIDNMETVCYLTAQVHADHGNLMKSGTMAGGKIAAFGKTNKDGAK